jgi:hypothetical protein
MISPLRSRLLDLAFDFVHEASKIDGVLAISLVGSILTSKPNPKDIDLLVKIEDTLELERLATLGRRIKGKTQSISAGADIFLVNPANKYLGRTCPWKICKFGVRLRCDAQNCGKRQYLHDDLQDITLKPELIEKPPLELFPKVVKRCKPPEDVENILGRFDT